MTNDGSSQPAASGTTAAADAADPDAADPDDGRLFCYRHPDRETWVRCGRCDRPICPRCAMQGPVGFRCRDCGRPAFDPLTSFTPAQALGGFAVAVGGGLLAALIASRIGFFSIIVSYFAGGFIAQGVTRVAGYKHGPVLLAIVFGGIVAGGLAAFAIDNGTLLALVGAAGGAGETPIGSMLVDALLWTVVGAGAACAGAWSRLR
jgi:hypothetical protein